MVVGSRDLTLNAQNRNDFLHANTKQVNAKEVFVGWESHNVFVGARIETLLIKCHQHCKTGDTIGCASSQQSDPLPVKFCKTIPSCVLLQKLCIVGFRGSFSVFVSNEERSCNGKLE